MNLGLNEVSLLPLPTAGDSSAPDKSVQRVVGSGAEALGTIPFLSALMQSLTGERLPFLPATTAKSLAAEAENGEGKKTVSSPSFLPVRLGNLTQLPKASGDAPQTSLAVKTGPGAAKAPKGTAHQSGDAASPEVQKQAAIEQSKAQSADKALMALGAAGAKAESADGAVTRSALSTAPPSNPGEAASTPAAKGAPANAPAQDAAEAARSAGQPTGQAAATDVRSQAAIEQSKAGAADRALMSLEAAGAQTPPATEQGGRATSTATGSPANAPKQNLAEALKAAGPSTDQAATDIRSQVTVEQPKTTLVDKTAATPGAVEVSISAGAEQGEGGQPLHASPASSPASGPEQAASTPDVKVLQTASPGPATGEATPDAPSQASVGRSPVEPVGQAVAKEAAPAPVTQTPEATSQRQGVAGAAQTAPTGDTGAADARSQASVGRSPAGPAGQAVAKEAVPAPDTPKTGTGDEVNRTVARVTPSNSSAPNPEQAGAEISRGGSVAHRSAPEGGQRTTPAARPAGDPATGRSVPAPSTESEPSARPGGVTHPNRGATTAEGELKASGKRPSVEHDGNALSNRVSSPPPRDAVKPDTTFKTQNSGGEAKAEGQSAIQAADSPGQGNTSGTDAGGPEHRSAGYDENQGLQAVVKGSEPAPRTARPERVTQSARPAARPPIVTQVEEGVSRAIATGRTSIKLQLHPPSLGSVNIHLSLGGKGVTVHIETANQAVKGLIEAQLDQLHAVLESRGMQLDGLSVVYNPAASASGNPLMGGHTGHGGAQPRQSTARRSEDRSAEPEEGSGESLLSMLDRSEGQVAIDYRA